MPEKGTEMEESMSVNGITSTASDVYTTGAYSSSTSKKTEAAADTAKTSNDTGVVYEPSNTETAASTKKTYKPDANLVAKLKADAEARTSQLRSLVESMMTKQANTYGKANDIWSFLASGNYTVDPATRAQAQADIAEDGYWGVEQTSNRIIDFATALTGGDPDKIEEMRAAFEKGFKQAGSAWGGSLPDISQRTYDAVMKKFDQMAADAGKTVNGND